MIGTDFILRSLVLDGVDSLFLVPGAVSRFGLHGFIEIVTLCGFYTLMAMVNACFDGPCRNVGQH
jgi:hypothetical protein